MPPSPPSPTATLVYATFGQRLLASFLDGLVIGGINLGLGLVAAVVTGILVASGGEGGGDNPMIYVVQGLIGIVQMVLGYGYFIYFIGKNGQTWGKKWVGIKVVNIETNLPPGYLNAFLREIIFKLISSIVFMLGYLWMLKDEKKQTWHDKLAHTVVVKV